MSINKQKLAGFTIIELLIVIVIIGILAAITIVAYNGIQTRGTAAREISDIKALDQAIKMYYVDHGSYPSSVDAGGTQQWLGWCQAANFIPGLVPTYIAKEPQQVVTSMGCDTSYLYTSNGADYKLISHVSPSGVCDSAVSSVPSMKDPVRVCWAFGTASSSTILSTW